jgi:hypothetical protein
MSWSMMWAATKPFAPVTRVFGILAKGVRGVWWLGWDCVVKDWKGCEGLV